MLGPLLKNIEIINLYYFESLPLSIGKSIWTGTLSGHNDTYLKLASQSLVGLSLNASYQHIVIFLYLWGGGYEFNTYGTIYIKSLITKKIRGIITAVTIPLRPIATAAKTPASSFLAMARAVPMP